MDKKKFGKKLLEILNEKGLTKRQFCLLIGINENSINSKIKLGSFTFVEMLRIMELFDIDLKKIKEMIDYISIKNKN